MTDDKKYRLAQVHIEGYERITFADVPLEAGLNVISGRNKAGKSSFVHFVRQLFEGKGARSTMPINDQGTAAEGFAVLTAAGKTEFTVELEIRADRKTDRLVIRDADGNPTAKGQEWLKSLIGRGVAFDPAEFLEPPGCKTKDARDKKRLEMLLRVAPLGVDLDALKTKREDFYARRTIANRDKENAAAKLATMQRLPVPEVVDLAEKRATVRQERERATKRAALTSAIGAIDGEMERLRARFTELKAQREKGVAELATIPDPVNVETLEAEVVAGEKTNVERERIVGTNARYDELLGDLGKAKKLADEMTEAMATVDRVKSDALAAAKMPVPGLSFGDDEVRFNGLPYEQASDAERLEIAFAVCAADRPALALALIDVGEVFEPEAVERIRGIAERLDIQVILARRSPDVARKVEFVDGRTPAREAGS